MQHDEFVEAYNGGRVQVDVDQAKALQIANAWEKLPMRFRHAHVFWSAAWLLSIPAAFASAFYSWWIGALILLVLTPALFAASKKSAALHVIDYAVESSVFYSYAVENSVISVRPKT